MAALVSFGDAFAIVDCTCERISDGGSGDLVLQPRHCGAAPYSVLRSGSNTREQPNLDTVQLHLGNVTFHSTEPFEQYSLLATFAARHLEARLASKKSFTHLKASVPTSQSSDALGASRQRPRSHIKRNTRTSSSDRNVRTSARPWHARIERCQ